MRYNVYSVESGTTITVTEVEAPEAEGFLTSVVLNYHVRNSTASPRQIAELAARSNAVLAEQSNRASQYGRDIRGIVRGLWSGSISFDQAFTLFSDTVRIGLTRAWHDGALECGIKPADLTPEELTAMRQVIASEDSRIFPFLLAIEQGSKANDGKFAPLKSRVDMWALRYSDVVTRAKLMACADQKLRWTINATRNVKINCSSCLKLDGKVKRASYWARVDVHPQQPPNPNLICKGYLCGCGLLQTDEPLSRGPLPNLP